MTRKCSSLKENEWVVFNRYSDILNRKEPNMGNVISVCMKSRTVMVVRPEGYRSESGFIPFEDMLAVYNPDGEWMKFGCITGNSDILIPE